MDLHKKVALVTGAAHRLGKAIAIGLAKEGMRIGLHFNHSEEQAKQTLSELKSLGVEAILIRGDFSSIDEIKAVVTKCNQHFNRIDVLVNNAALYFKTLFGQTAQEQWDTLLNVNLRATFFCAQFAAEVMQKQQNGKIINIADVAGITPWRDYIAYCASKAGVISITKGMAQALAPYIQVNAIAPGTVKVREEASEKEIEEVKELTLLKRIGDPKDIVNTVIFLLKGSDYITGEVIAVDGGRLLAH